AQERPPMKVDVADLADAHLEAAAQIRNERPDHGALLFAGAYVAEQQVEFDRADPHTGQPARRRPRPREAGTTRSQAAVQPPSEEMIAPFMLTAAGEARCRASVAMSSGWARRVGRVSQALIRSHAHGVAGVPPPAA